MLNEGKGISNSIKNDVHLIYDLFKLKSYMNHLFNFNDRDIIICFNKLNNYYSNIIINKDNVITMNIGIPDNHNEKRVKEIISHELTHITEILGLNNKDFPKYNKIKKSLLEFNKHQMSSAMEFVTDIFYKTLDNEINANVAQTYIYIKGDGRINKEQALKKLKEWKTYMLYDNIKNIDINILESKIDSMEIETLNNIFIKNGVKTTKTNWLNYWFKIFKQKADIFLKNSIRILDEVESDFEKFTEYASNNSIDIKLKRFDEFKY